MTSRERWLALYRRERPDRIPTDYWATDEVTGRLLRELRCASEEELFTKLHIDAPFKIEPPKRVSHHPDDPASDIWGLRRRIMDYGGGSYEEFDNHPLEHFTTAREVDSYRWPTAEYHDFGLFGEMIRKAPQKRIVRSGDYEPFLLYCALRGLEQALIDLAEGSEVLTRALAHIFDYHYEVARRAFEIGQGRIDVTYIAEDLGGQNSLLMSLEHIRTYILPNQRRMADLARSHGIHNFYHTDGDIRAVIPDLIGVTGIELLNPIQWRCPSMERRALVKDFGSRIIFHGAMDNQQTLPFGTSQDVRREVMENIGIFGGARWICAPCHNIQALTPTENIVAMYETIYEYGRL